MADVSHELGALRHVVDSSLSSKVAMFNNQAQQHKNSQLLNPFSTPDGRSSPKPTFSKGEYGKPLAGSLTEMRGQKANMHVMREMLELCQIINSEGYDVKDEPGMRVIPFGELFNIYNYISDKVVGILLRARKYKYVDFEGEMLFQRRDDDVPVFLLRPIVDIRREIDGKIEEIKRGASPAPQSTSVLLDKAANDQRLKDLAVPKSARNSKSRSQSPAAAVKAKSLSATPSPTPTPSTTPSTNAESAKPPPSPTTPKKAAKASGADDSTATTAAAVDAIKPEVTVEAPLTVETIAAPAEPAGAAPVSAAPAVKPLVETTIQIQIESQPATEPTPEPVAVNVDAVATVATADAQIVAETTPQSTEANVLNESSNELPTIVIEATAVCVRSASVTAAAEDAATEPQLTTSQAIPATPMSPPEPVPEPVPESAAISSAAI